MKLVEAFILIALAAAVVVAAVVVGTRALVERYRLKKARWKVVTAADDSGTKVLLEKYGEDPITLGQPIPHGQADRLYKKQQDALEECAILNASNK